MVSWFLSSWVSGPMRYGVSGRSGGTCPFIHRKVCRAYQLYGSDKRKGCTKKENCDYWHPPLCYNSVNTRECLNEKCRFWHLKGTVRSRETENNASQPEAPHNPQTTNQSDFLGQLKAQMSLELHNMMRQQQQQMMQQINQQFVQMMMRFNPQGQMYQATQTNPQVQHNPQVQQQVYQQMHPQPQGY